MAHVSSHHEAMNCTLREGTAFNLTPWILHKESQVPPQRDYLAQIFGAYMRGNGLCVLWSLLPPPTNQSAVTSHLIGSHSLCIQILTNDAATI